MLSAVDSAVMLVDAGKGLEPQTLKLFKVCALRGIPVITVINKWDRPGLSALELMDLIEQQIKLRPTPADLAGRRGRRLPRRAGPSYGRVREVHPHRRRRHPRPRAADAGGRGRRGRRAPSGRTPSRSTSCSPPTTPTTTRRRFLAGRDDAGHVRLGAAELRRRAAARPAARPRPGAAARPRASTARSARSTTTFSAFVFKVQSGMNAAHRDRLAYARVVSGDLRARHDRHPRRRPAGRSRRSTPRPSSAGRLTVDRARLPRRHHRPGQRAGAARRRHDVRRRPRSSSRRSRASPPSTS